MLVTLGSKRMKKIKKALIFQDVYCVMTKHIQTNQNNTEIKIAAF